MMLIATAAPILLVGDRTASDRNLHSTLRRKGYVFADAPAINDAVRLLESVRCSAVIVDLTALDQSGLALLRRACEAPVLAVCADQDEAAIVRAVELGVDDVVTAPIRIGEFLGRVESLVRRSQRRSSERLQAGELALDCATRRVQRNGESIRLTRTEFEILALLMRHPNRVLSQQRILEHVWGPHHGEYSQTLRVHVGHIRKKIEPNPAAPRYVLTDPGVGYVLRSDAEAPPPHAAFESARSAAAGR